MTWLWPAIGAVVLLAVLAFAFLHSPPTPSDVERQKAEMAVALEQAQAAVGKVLLPPLERGAQSMEAVVEAFRASRAEWP